MRIALVSLGEAGNFGDDLILLAALSSIGAAVPESEVQFLSFGQHIPLDRLAEDLRMTFPRRVERLTAGRFWPVKAERHRHFKDPDVVVVGGGGLLQTSHHPLRPYHWLGYVPRKKVPVLGIGLGLGPLSPGWERYFRRRQSPFSRLFVRDSESRNLAASYGWAVEECEDFIDTDFLSRLSEVGVSSASVQRLSSEVRTLGVALRQWPGLDAEVVARHVERVALEHEVDCIKFFVLETTRSQGPDIRFTEEVDARLRWNGTVEHADYHSSNLFEFLEAMSEVDVAISMKLHSSAYWSSLNVPIYPIVYAPKISSFFGLPYRGLEILNEPHQVSLEHDTISAREALALALNSEQLSSVTARGSLFSQVQHTTLHAWSSAINIQRAAARKLRKEVS